jgi:small-conductance mechanosensitive channel
MSEQMLHESIQAAVSIAVAIIVAIVARKVLTFFAAKLDRTESSIADDLLRAMRMPAVVLILLAGIYVAMSRLSPLDRVIHRHSGVFEVGVLLAVLIGLTNTVNILTAWYARKLADETYQSHTSIVRKLAILAVWTIGCVEILSILGVKVTTLLASLGIAGLAVGLALQDTVANLFAGFSLVADRTVRAGNYIKLESGEEGFVESVGWRNTRIRLWANNIVLVPNAKLTQSIITNLSLPDHTLSVYTWCGVSYDSDLERVEAVTLDVARKVLGAVEGSDLNYDPVLRYKKFGDSNIEFVVIFRAVDVGAQYRLQHEFIKALHRRFKNEGIEISFPVRKLVWDAKSPAGVGGRSMRGAVADVPIDE